MKPARVPACIVFVILCVPAAAVAEPVDGAYFAEEEPSLRLTLTEGTDGDVAGSMVDPGATMPVSAHRRGPALSGTIGSPSAALPFTAVIEPDGLSMDVGSPGETYRLTFRRSDRAAEAPADDATSMPSETAGSDDRSATPAAAGRSVVINDRRLTDDELARLEHAYGIRIGDADYWYDPVLGAWGLKGGPTMGFIAAGLALGGPLRADASGGGTQVFVNGREIHAYDLLALQQVTGPIMPGRYFIDSRGLAGFEGGPPLWNLAAMAAQSHGGGDGSNTWQSRLTGASGFSDGHTGAVFLPNGGIVSTGD
jgi:hypothetical protein